MFVWVFRFFWYVVFNYVIFLIVGKFIKEVKLGLEAVFRDLFCFFNWVLVSCRRVTVENNYEECRVGFNIIK